MGSIPEPLKTASSIASSSTAGADDSNRIIAVVTGANSGFGLGICHELLANLSVPTGATIPAAVPRREALPPSVSSMVERIDDASAHMRKPHPSLTLVLACRSESNAVEARAKILARHKKDLARRRSRGEPVPDNWEESLRVEYELVDLDQLGGDQGILAFTKRMTRRYPHITSLFLNAGYAAIQAVSIPKVLWSMIYDGFITALYRPRYNIEGIGLKSRDGERGRVWGINVLAPYIIAKELEPLLRASPEKLFEPRVVYTSSVEAEAEALYPDQLQDYQLLTHDGSYRASKYMGDLVMSQLDAEFGVSTPTQPRAVRCLIAEPGCVTTNIAAAGLGTWQWLVKLKFMAYWLAFLLAHLLGSRFHPVWATAGALPMLYCAYVADQYLPPATKVPGPKLHVISRRLRTPTVGYGEVDEWESHTDVAQGLRDRCEQIRQEWRSREGIDL